LRQIEGGPRVHKTLTENKKSKKALVARKRESREAG